MLTSKQNKFIEGIIEGSCQSDAYRLAYDRTNMSSKTIWEAMTVYLKTPRL